MPSIVLFGDSITQGAWSAGDGPGWAAMLAERYVRRADIINRGYSGYTTRWALQQLPHDFPAATPNPAALVTVFLGANDSALEGLNPRQHVPLDEYRKNLKTIIEHIQATGAKAITPPPVNADGWKAFMQTRDATQQGDRDNSVTAQYAEAAKSVAAELGCGAVDLWTTMQEARQAPESGWHTFLSDGLHLTAAGNAFVFERLVEVIDAKHAEFKVVPCKYSGAINSGSSSELKQRFPWHDAITVDTALDAAVVP
eukprot:gene19766-14296_t